MVVWEWNEEEVEGRQWKKETGRPKEVSRYNFSRTEFCERVIFPVATIVGSIDFHACISSTDSWLETSWPRGNECKSQKAQMVEPGERLVD